MIATIKTVLLSVFDKTGIAEFATRLHSLDRGILFLATDGTAAHLERVAPELSVESLSRRIGQPQTLDGQVKTLDFSLYTAILLGREEVPPDPLPPIDLIVCNLYPFEEGCSEGLSLERARKLIDVGGVSLLRAGAKNYLRVTTLCDREDFTALGDELQRIQGISLRSRIHFSKKAFFYTSAYDKMIAEYFQKHASEA